MKNTALGLPIASNGMLLVISVEGDLVAIAASTSFTTISQESIDKEI